MVGSIKHACRYPMEITYLWLYDNDIDSWSCNDNCVTAVVSVSWLIHTQTFGQHNTLILYRDESSHKVHIKQCIANSSTGFMSSRPISWGVWDHPSDVCLPPRLFWGCQAASKAGSSTVSFWQAGSVCYYAYYHICMSLRGSTHMLIVCLDNSYISQFQIPYSVIHFTHPHTRPHPHIPTHTHTHTHTHTPCNAMYITLSSQVYMCEIHSIILWDISFFSESLSILFVLQRACCVRNCW